MVEVIMDTDSIFESVKKFIGFDEDYTPFDQDLLILINSELSTLSQLGINIPSGYQVTDSSGNWSDILDPSKHLETVKEYICLKVKTIFDPSANSTVMQAYKDKIKELEWRINVEVDNGDAK